MKVEVAVTYEYATRPPQTWRGVVEGGREHVCARLAMKAARASLRPVKWSSLVVVLLERIGDSG